MDFGFTVFPAIACLCYFIGLAIKTFGTSEKLDKFIPIICGASGIALGLVTYFTIPGYIPADNWIVAMCIGLVSGLSATGINQIYKQFSEK